MALALAATLLIQSGLFDPQPIGSQTSELTPSPLSVPAGETERVWLNSAELPDAFSLRLTATHRDGPLDSGAGLMLGTPEHAWMVAVSPTGTLSIWQEDGDTISAELPWQSWPHVGVGDAANEIWLNVDGDSAEVWINREWLWAGELTLDDEAQFGVVGINFAEAGDSAEFDLSPLRLTTP